MGCCVLTPLNERGLGSKSMRGQNRLNGLGACVALADPGASGLGATGDQPLIDVAN